MFDTLLIRERECRLLHLCWYNVRRAGAAIRRKSQKKRKKIVQTSLVLFLPSVTRYSILDLYQAVIVTLSSFVQHPVAFHRLSVGDTDTSATMPSHLCTSLSRLRQDSSMPSPTPPIYELDQDDTLSCAVGRRPSIRAILLVDVLGWESRQPRVATLGKDHDKKERKRM